MNQLAMEEADSYNDCSWGAFDYDEEESEGEGEDVGQAEADSHRPSTKRCRMPQISHTIALSKYFTPAFVNILCNQIHVFVFNNNNLFT